MQVALSTKISYETYQWLEYRSKEQNISKAQIVEGALVLYKERIEELQREKEGYWNGEED